MSNWDLSEESFSLFLSWLDPDRDVAGEKYKKLQHRLIVMFDSRGCTRSEELADKALNNFIRRLPALIGSYASDHDPAPYLYTIAHHLYIEYIEKQPAALPEDIPESSLRDDTPDESEARLYDCLEKCLAGLGPRSSELVLNYYRGEKQAKIDFRKRLAERMGIAVNALRIRVHRIRCALEKCIDGCLGGGLPSETE
jgi:DNA-directed RNA polymerase specialized sigma24 family protein